MNNGKYVYSAATGYHSLASVFIKMLNKYFNYNYQNKNFIRIVKYPNIVLLKSIFILNVCKVTNTHAC